MSKRTRNIIITLAVGTIFNIVLALAKLFVGLRTNSITIMLDSTNSFFDTLACIVTIAAFVVVGIKVKDKSFGFGRSEYLASFLISVMVVIVGGAFFIQALARVTMPTPVWFTWTSFAIMACALVVKICLGTFYAFVNKRLKSDAIKALVADSILDSIITAVALLSYGLSATESIAIDGILGVVLAIIVVVFGIKMVVDNSRMIIANKSDKFYQEISQVLQGYDFVSKIVDIQVHDYGFMRYYAVAKVVLEDKDLDSYFDNIDKVKAQIMQEIGVNLEIAIVKIKDEELIQSETECQI